MSNEPVTYAEWNIDNPPWCSIYHICPSNIAWLEFYGPRGPKHLVPRRWIQDKDTTPETLVGVPKHYVRSDGMILIKFRAKTLCGLELASLYTIHIGAWKWDCCVECWAKRW